MDFIKDKIRVTCEQLKKYAYEDLGTVENLEFVESEYKDGNTPPESGWKPFSPENDRLGGREKHWWMRTKLHVPEVGEGKQIALELLTSSSGWDALNPQMIVYLDGHMVQGVDVNHTEVLLEGGTSADLLLYIYSSMNEAKFDFSAKYKGIDLTSEAMYYDLYVPYSSLDCFDPKSERHINTLKQLELAVNLLDLNQPKSPTYYASITVARGQLEKTFYKGLCGKGDAIVACVGHTHIDVAWLWPLRQTVEKAQRSFATVVNLMKQYPEYKFMSSQPQLYQFVKEQAPELYKEIKKLVKEGRWEVEGATWLEMDTNLVSGESLVRQMIYGKRFMKEEFGVDSKILWLPDVFGYSAALPQIMRKSGVDNFMTTKIAWNERNMLPYDSFYWEGIDGSRVFSFFVTTQDRPQPRKNEIACTYNGRLTAGQILGTWERYQQKAFNNRTMTTFGYGDGGGGPTKEMLETQRRLSYGLPGIPKTEMSFAGEAIATARKNFDKTAKELKRFPLWVGELYLEFHRGTYTSIAKNKKNNRKSEFLYQKAETLAVTDELLLGGKYPQKKLADGWRTILLNQFHDIIPGSSIFEVYEDSDKQYAEVKKIGEKAAEDAKAHIAANIGTEGGVAVFNPTGFTTDGEVQVDGKTGSVKGIPAHGWKVTEPDFDCKVKLDGRTADNKYYKMIIDINGNISRLYDKKNKREVFKRSEVGNEIQIFEDLPRQYDAWEISDYYKQKMYKPDEVLEIKQITDGCRAGFRIKKRILTSTIEQNIWLYSDNPRIDFETVMDWNEEHLLVKAAFPIDVLADKATYEIQFGHLQRPTHENTSWDKARFEVCAHKWADISEVGYGVSLLNDCKYGYNAEGSTLKLTLLKCATSPNPQADKGHHEFTYSLLPHVSNLRNTGTIKQAYLLNCPFEAVKLGKQKGKLAEDYSLASCDGKNVVIETVKKAEDGDGVIVRLYESFGKRCNTTVKFGFGVERVSLCDLLENEIRELTVRDGKVRLGISNFQIITLKVRAKR
ncbi:MAG TPA: alpha-mannosidase [Oscillospiraceae bacterium]|nr:alpha-mannosidase [Oscillospiraceae bacterium]HPK34826.1 alpha-mannosidase [Oscillospiraceae bacterium]HPR76891.1 alpha-mannosidase [Oscillospiraceae bacterium]